MNMEHVCAVCGRKLEPLDVDRTQKIAWYACPLYTLNETDDAKDHTVISAPIEEEIDEELVDRKR